VVQLAALVAFALTTAIFTNPGIAGNHLLDLVCLLILVAAEGAAMARSALLIRRPEGPPSAGSLQLRHAIYGFFMVSFLWFSATAFQVSGRFAEWRSAVSTMRGHAMTEDPSLDPTSWRQRFAVSDRLLSTDASIPVLMGQRPVILDSFMLKIIADRNPAARRDLVRRIDAREFDWILSVTSIRGPWAGKSLAEVHWGSDVAHAIEREYEPRGYFWTYVVYGPKSRPGGAPQSR
jgi:hypothetical protein